MDAKADATKKDIALIPSTIPGATVMAGVTPFSTGSEVIKLFSCSTQLSMNIFLLINVKMSTTVGILTCMSGKNSILGLSESRKKRNFNILILMSIKNFMLN